MHIPVLLWKERTIPVEVHVVGVEYAQVGRVLGVPTVSQRQKLKHNRNYKYQVPNSKITYIRYLYQIR